MIVRPGVMVQSGSSSNYPARRCYSSVVLQPSSTWPLTSRPPSFQSVRLYELSGDRDGFSRSAARSPHESRARSWERDKPTRFAPLVFFFSR